MDEWGETDGLETDSFMGAKSDDADELQDLNKFWRVRAGPLLSAFQGCRCLLEAGPALDQVRAHTPDPQAFNA